MKTIYVMRHAKSSWSNTELPDHERPLLGKGIKRSILVAEWMKKKDHIPECIISSPAVRAMETARIMAATISKGKISIWNDKRLFEGSAEEYFEIFYELSDSIDSVMLVGHNPEISKFIELLIKKKHEEMSTSAIAAIKVDAKKWIELAVCKRQLKFFVSAKTLNAD